MQLNRTEVGGGKDEDSDVELSSCRKCLCQFLAGGGYSMRKKLLVFFFFLSLGGNGSFLSIKDAVTCLQHHVGYNRVCTRNFCQLIFPCPGARRRAVCPHGRQPLPPFCVPGVGTRTLGLAGVAGTCHRRDTLSRCCLFLPTWRDL